MLMFMAEGAYQNLDTNGEFWPFTVCNFHPQMKGYGKSG